MDVFWIFYVSVICFVSGYFVGSFKEFRWGKNHINTLLTIANSQREVMSAQHKVINEFLSSTSPEKIKKAMDELLGTVEKASKALE